MKNRILILFYLISLTSCSKYLLNLENKDIYDIQNVGGKELKLKLKKIYIPYDYYYGLGTPAHFENIWVSKEAINEIFEDDQLTKRRLLRKLNSWNGKTEEEAKIIRIPSNNELDRFKINSEQTLTIEKLNTLKNRDVIKKDIIVVRTFSSLSDSTSFSELK